MGMNTRAGIKSVTRGILTIASTQLTATATIPAVNLAKTEVRYLGNETGAAQSNDGLIRLYLNNSTTIGAIRGSPNGGGTASYEITEWF